VPRTAVATSAAAARARRDVVACRSANGSETGKKSRSLNRSTGRPKTAARSPPEEIAPEDGRSVSGRRGTAPCIAKAVPTGAAGGHGVARRRTGLRPRAEVIAPLLDRGVVDGPVPVVAGVEQLPLHDHRLRAGGDLERHAL